MRRDFGDGQRPTDAAEVHPIEKIGFPILADGEDDGALAVSVGKVDEQG